MAYSIYVIGSHEITCNLSSSVVAAKNKDSAISILEKKLKNMYIERDHHSIDDAFESRTIYANQTDFKSNIEGVIYTNFAQLRRK